MTLPITLTRAHHQGTSPPMSRAVSVVFSFKASHKALTPRTPILFPVSISTHVTKHGSCKHIHKWGALTRKGNTPYRLSDASTVSSLSNTWLSATAPLSPMSFPVHCHSSISSICAILKSIVHNKHSTFTFVSVVFPFNASHSTFMPSSPTRLSVHTNQHNMLSVQSHHRKQCHCQMPTHCTDQVLWGLCSS